MSCYFKYTWRYARRNRYIAYKKQLLGKVPGCIRSICKKASAKLNALARVSPYNDEKKKMTNYKCFFSIPTLTTALLYGCSTVEN